jgi:hypothetical protein
MLAKIGEDAMANLDCLLVCLLRRLAGEDLRPGRGVVVSSLDEKEPFPVLFQFALDLSFAEFARASRQKAGDG